MKDGLPGSLENAIDEWANAKVTGDELPGGAYWPDMLVENMARAAAAVFDANIDGQVFLRNAEG